MPTVRLGAVDYLNARPLVYGLELRNDLFTLRFDVPSKCAALLHEGSIDVGMIPSIEYPARRAVIGSCRARASFRTGRWRRSRSSRRRRSRRSGRIAADTSSRTSNALLHILCVERFGIDPEFRPMHPDAGVDAAALRRRAADRRPGAVSRSRARSARPRSISASEWTAMTGLPFVWAFWAGRPGRSTPRRRGAPRRARRRRGRVGRDCGVVLRPRTRRARQGVSEGEYPVHPRRARRRGAADVLRARWQARAGGDGRAAVFLSPMSITTISRRKIRGGGRLDRAEALRALHARADGAPRPARRRGARPQAPRTASSPTSSTATSTTRTSASRGATSARSTGRSDRPKGTCSGSRRSSGRSTRRSRSAAASCCCRAGTTPTCRWRGTRICSGR